MSETQRSKVRAYVLEVPDEVWEEAASQIDAVERLIRDGYTFRGPATDNDPGWLCSLEPTIRAMRRLMGSAL